jgi:hypothetical protein
LGCRVSQFHFPSGRQETAQFPAANNAFLYDVQVTWIPGNLALPVFYADLAPGEIDGLDKINVQLPVAARNPILTVSVPSSGFDSLPGKADGLTVFTR